MCRLFSHLLVRPFVRSFFRPFSHTYILLVQFVLFSLQGSPHKLAVIFVVSKFLAQDNDFPAF